MAKQQTMAQRIQKGQKDLTKGMEQLHKARSEYGSMFRENPTHAYNPITGQLEKVKGA